MRPDVEKATDRVAVMRARLVALPAGEVPFEEIEDALCEGYARALAGDAWLRRSEQELQALLDDSSRTVSVTKQRGLASEHRQVHRQLSALRRELIELRDDRDRLRAGTRLKSA